MFGQTAKHVRRCSANPSVYLLFYLERCSSLRTFLVRYDTKESRMVVFAYTSQMTHSSIVLYIGIRFGMTSFEFYWVNQVEQVFGMGEWRIAFALLVCVIVCVPTPSSSSSVDVPCFKSNPLWRSMGWSQIVLVRWNIPFPVPDYCWVDGWSWTRRDNQPIQSSCRCLWWFQNRGVEQRSVPATSTKPHRRHDQVSGVRDAGKSDERWASYVRNSATITTQVVERKGK